MESQLLLADRFLLGTIFAVAVVGKVRSVARFRQFTLVVQQLTGLPGGGAAALAGLLVAGEAATALLIALPSTSRLGFVAATGLLAAFAGVVVMAVRRGVFTECHCFGGSGAVMSYPVIMRNALLLAFAVPGIVLASAGRSPSLGPAAVLAAALGLALAVVFVRYYDRLIQFVVERKLGPAPVPGEGH